MKKPEQWKPDVLVAMWDRRRFIVSDSYIAARVPSLDPWGLPLAGTYWKGKRGAPYAPRASGRNTDSLAKALQKMALESEAEAWPLASEMDYAADRELFIHPDGCDLAWLWTNEHGDPLAFNAKFFDDLSVLVGLSAEREYTFTCGGPTRPMFIWDHQRGRDVWLGAIMPVRFDGGLVRVAELPNGTAGRGKAA